MIDTILRWLLERFGEEELTAQEPVPVFVTFPYECKEQVVLSERLDPGQIAVTDCANCGLKWSVLLPSLQISQVKDQPLLYPHLEQIA